MARAARRFLDASRRVVVGDRERPLGELWDRHTPPSTGLVRAAELDADLQRTVLRTSYMRQLFYVVVLLVALAGQVSGAVKALGIPLIWAIPAVGALELGGIVVLANADVRRRLGERAVASRFMSALIAAFAVAFNWMAHDTKLLAGFFAGMSALGYLVWLMHTENQRRDRLRAKGDLPPTTPAYEVVGHWVCHPRMTLRAKNLAKADPTLGLYGSLAAARAEQRKELRTAAISKVLHRKIRAAVDPTTADIAIAVYDLDEIAHRLADGADYDGLTALIAQDLAPAQLAAPPAPPAPQAAADSCLHALNVAAPRPTATLDGAARFASVEPVVDAEAAGHRCVAAAPLPGSPLPGAAAAPVNRAVAEKSDPAGAAADRTLPRVPADTPPASGGFGGPLRPASTGTDVGGFAPIQAADPPTWSPAVGAALGAPHHNASLDQPEEANDTDNSGDGDEHAGAAPYSQHDPDERRDNDASVPHETAAAVAYWCEQNPGLHPRDIAARIGRSERTVRRYLPQPVARGPARPGGT
ncbi:hypothetical protein ABZS66_39645 [Dactylosporangium sp. NPDC005572]|uniref:hypothetical protein n=1 Tax=Dactylosporangium sp. NPDC005572 TaxID=3156889 RepID=UPI0033A655CF